MIPFLLALHGLILFPLALASNLQNLSSSPSKESTYPYLLSDASSNYTSPPLTSGLSRKVSSLTTDTTCFNIRTFSSASGSVSSCCGDCTIVYPDVQILHWPVTRTNTWCDSIKAGLSQSPFSTLAIGSPGTVPPGAVVGYRNVSTADFDKSLLTQGPAFIFESVNNYGNVFNPSTTSVGRSDSHVTRPPTNVSYSIDDNGFVYVSPSIYVVMNYVIATDDCSPIPPIWTSVILAYPEGKVLTRWDPDFPASFLDPADLGCPPEYNYLFTVPEGVNGAVMTSTRTEGRIRIPDQLSSPGGLDRLRTYIAEYTPSLLPAFDLQKTMNQLAPQWKYCSGDPGQRTAYPFGRDPPKVIQPMNILAGPTTNGDNQPTVTNMPSMPHAVPPPPVPIVTAGPDKPQIQDTPVLQSSTATQDIPDPSDSNNPLATQDPNQGTQAGVTDQIVASKAPQNHPLDLSYLSNLNDVIYGSATSGFSSPQNHQPGSEPSPGTVYPLQGPETLPIAPAFAPLNPKPLETGNVVAAGSSNFPGPPNVPPDATSAMNGATTAGIGAIVNAAFNGLLSSYGLSPPGSLAGTPSSSALGEAASSSLDMPSVSYSRPFSLSGSQDTILTNAPSTSTTRGFPDTSNSGSQASFSLPSLVVDSGTALSSTSVESDSSLSTSQSEDISITTQGGSAQTGVTESSKSTSTTRGSGPKQAENPWWSMWTMVAFVLVLIF